MDDGAGGPPVHGEILIGRENLPVLDPTGQ